MRSGLKNGKNKTKRNETVRNVTIRNDNYDR